MIQDYFSNINTILIRKKIMVGMGVTSMVIVNNCCLCALEKKFKGCDDRGINPEYVYPDIQKFIPLEIKQEINICKL